MKKPKKLTILYLKKLSINFCKNFKRNLFKHLEHPISDLYHWLLTISWISFFGLSCLFYFLINIIFAFAYLTTNNGIANAKEGSFSDASWYSRSKNELFLAQCDAEILIILTGLDETFSSIIHSRYLYEVKDILWSMRFVDILSKSKRGKYHIDRERGSKLGSISNRGVDYRHFHDVIALDE